jgi:hypothetical protein
MKLYFYQEMNEMKKYEDILMICTKYPELLRDKDARIPLFAAWRMNCLDGFVGWLKSHKLKKRTLDAINDFYEEFRDHPFIEPTEEQRQRWDEEYRQLKMSLK